MIGMTLSKAFLFHRRIELRLFPSYSRFRGRGNSLWADWLLVRLAHRRPMKSSNVLIVHQYYADVLLVMGGLTS